MITASSLVLLDEEEFDEQFVVIDHRSEEEEVVEAIAEKIVESLDSFWEDDELWVSLNGERYKLPLTVTPHDRYVAISSLAELLKQQYTFWLATDSLQDDTHYLLILSNQVSEELKKEHSEFMQDKLTELELGHDYFGGLDVPYLHHEDHNPEFKQQAKELAEALHEFRSELQTAIEGDEDVKKIIKNMRKELGTDGLSRFMRFVRRYWLFGFAISWMIYSYIVQG